VKHGKIDSLTPEKVRIAPDDGVFELTGAEPAWIWVHTCPTFACSCRSALVLATQDGREQLLERGCSVRDAWNTGGDFSKAALTLDDLIVFHIDIDTNQVLASIDFEPLDLAAHPIIKDIAMRINGDLLDSIGQLWYRGKGRPDPEQEALLATEIKIKGWQRGDLVAWNDVCTGVRQDYYVLDGQLHEADEMYCPVADCDCGEVLIYFETLNPLGSSTPGVVVVQRSGATEIRQSKTGSDLLEQLWAAFKLRHPNYLARFARRYLVIKSIGARLVSVSTPLKVVPKVGRNDSCPCGSGKKYKKCCGAN